ncbi:MAG TPA: DUF3480 domain-containing protein [Kofleriaceae bacterium]|jgi:hypothetical protein|nr:DUF3480 domain-containing protein [Kofleriaceae bacterium]
MSSEPQPSAPVSVEIVAGQLSARVYPHEIATQQTRIACWSYVTDGLAAHGQPEIVFTLRREPGEAVERFPEEPLRLFSAIFELAARGQRVTAGGQTEFGDTRFFDHHLLYARAQPLAGVRLPPGCLAALLVTADELRAVRAFGPARVLARMGQAATHYPFPPWADRKRRGLAMDRTFEASVLSKLPRASDQHVHVTLHGDRIVISAPRAEQPAWRDRLAQLPDGVPLTLLTALDPAANGCLVWVPGQKEPEAIIPNGSDASRVGGCFLALFPDQPANTGRILEDGFAMQLTGEAWQALRRALIEGEELAIPAAEGMACALTWRDEAEASVEAELDSDAGEDDATGDLAAAEPGTTRVALDAVRLLTSEAELAARASADQIAAFCRELQRCVERMLADRNEPLGLRLRVICRPRSHRVGMAHRGELSEDALDALIDALEQLPSPPVRGEVSFELELSVAAGPRERFE